MANYLDANLGDARMIAVHRDDGHMVPVAENGAFLGLTNHRRADLAPLANPMPVEDYVVGLELLGYRFHLQKGQDGKQVLFRQEPDLPPSWDAHFLRITEAFGPGRTGEVRAFVIERDGAR